MNETGYFGPDSITWQLYREPFAILGGVRALLLQVAHPAVAEGVAKYSTFQSDPFGRGFRTFKAMARIYFGDKQQADQTAARLQKMHSGIRGNYPQPALEGTHPYEVAFVATDPELMMWVLATLTDTTLKVYEWLPGQHLPPDWRERFYEESKITARLFGIPDTLYPADLQAFNAYFNTILNSDLLGSTPACRTIAQAIVRHPKAPGAFLDRFAEGWLPRPLCERLGITIHPEPEKRLAKLLRRAAGIFRLIPRALRYSPAYHQAHYRIARAKGDQPTLAGRFFEWLAVRVGIPFGL